MSAKINQPSPQIFTSDPLEQIYAKSVMGPVYGGLAGMMASIQSNRRRMNQDDYLEGLEKSNTIAARAAQQELAAKHQQELIKGAIDLMKLGQPGESMPILQAIIKQGLNSGSDLHRRLIESEIAKNSRDPNGGGGGIEVTGEVGQGGPGGIRIKGKGANSLDAVNQAVKRQLEINKENGYTFDPAAAARFAMQPYQR